MFFESSEGISPPNSKATKGDGPPTLTLGRKDVKSLLASELKEKTNYKRQHKGKKKERNEREAGEE